MRTTRSTLSIAVAMLLFLSACSGADGDADTAATPTATAEQSGEAPEASATLTSSPETASTSAAQRSPSTEPEPRATANSGAEIEVDASSTLGIAETSLGTILVAGDGQTLYTFDDDDQGTSTCTGQCASNWPPLIVDGSPIAGESIDQALLGTTERDNGSLQVTYNGWPLYRWASDENPGDVTGHQVNDAWWVIGPDGTPLRS